MAQPKAPRTKATRNILIPVPYQKVMSLVVLLALENTEGLQLTDLQTLARTWKVNPYGDRHTLLIRLAQHALQTVSKEQVT